MGNATQPASVLAKAVLAVGGLALVIVGPAAPAQSAPPSMDAASASSSSPSSTTASPGVEGCKEERHEEKVVAFLKAQRSVGVDVVHADDPLAKRAADAIAQVLLQHSFMVRVRPTVDDAPDAAAFARVDVTREDDRLVFVFVDEKGQEQARWTQGCNASDAVVIGGGGTGEGTIGLGGVGGTANADDNADDEPTKPTKPTAGVLGALRAGDDAAGLFDEGAPSTTAAQDDAAAKERRRRENDYLDRMLWLDETRVATSGGGVIRHYALFMGRDKKELSLEETIALTRDVELQQRYADIQATLGGQQVVAWSSLGAGITIAAGGAALMMTPLLVDREALPEDVPWTLAGGVALGVGLGVGLAATVFLPDLVFPIEAPIEEHEIRRMVREYNEKLRHDLQLDVQRTSLPSGLPGQLDP